MGSMLLEIFPVSPRGFESFTRRFSSPFGAIFKRGGDTGKISNNIEPIRGNLNEHIYIYIHNNIVNWLMARKAEKSKKPINLY